MELTPAQGTILLVLAALSFVAGIGMLLWSWARRLWSGIKRRWPFALARTVRQLRTKLREAHDRIEQLELENKSLQADRESVYDLHQDTKRENAKLKQQLMAAERGGSSPLPAQPIELGDTAPLFLFEGSRFVPEDDSERRTIFFPDMLAQWAGAITPAWKAGRTFLASGTEFDNCDIYGPGVFVLADGSVDDTFHKCDWEEEWQAFWPATKPARYVGAIALKNCKFRRCNFKGVSFVVKPDEYERIYRRFTGNINGP